MNAQEANRKTMITIEDSIPIYYIKIMKEIEVSISSGDFFTYYEGDCNKYVYKKLQKLLEKEGYCAKLYSAEYSDGIYISWK